MNICILSIIYLEPEWQQTKTCIEATGLPVVYIDRKGVGSLSKAINEGAQLCKGFDYTWIITNVLFNNFGALELIKEAKNWAAIHPTFASDHLHIRQGKGVIEVPFIEFTAPIVETSLLLEFPLDEKMPYWGMDLDFGYRLRQDGYKLGVHHGVKISHEYIRNNKGRHYITERRKLLRRQTDLQTRNRLIEKYGNDWRDKVNYYGKI